LPQAAKDTSGKPSFRRQTLAGLTPEMRPNIEKNLRNVKLLKKTVFTLTRKLI
jgi:hypothetical protein